MTSSLFAFMLGFLLDMIIGDPHWLYHPVQLLGRLITVLETFLRRRLPKTKSGELAGGIFLVIIAAVISTGIPALVLIAAGNIHPVLRFVLETIMCYQLLATKALKDESNKVYQQLEQGNLEGGRAAVSMIVGRDTQKLDEAGITRAAVETIAENTSDGVIAPMLFMVIGGAAFGWFYKSVNTMDSMIGYKNEAYLYFGRAAAKLDDVLNYLPARLSAGLMIAASYFMKMRMEHAWKIYRRDRHNHASPNSGQTEAVMAGALGIRLAGDAWYFGTLHKKKTIGDELRSIEYRDIKKANKLLYGTAILAMILFSTAKAAFIL